jgi:hypothetical protein
VIYFEESCHVIGLFNEEVLGFFNSCQILSAWSNQHSQNCPHMDQWFPLILLAATFLPYIPTICPAWLFYLEDGGNKFNRNYTASYPKISNLDALFCCEVSLMATRYFYCSVWQIWGSTNLRHFIMDGPLKGLYLLSVCMETLFEGT